MSDSGLLLLQGSVDLRGGPIAAADIDLDEQIDLVIGSRQGELALYRNQGGLRFADVTDEVGLPRSLPIGAIATGDLDNDGDQDLIVAGDDEISIFENREGTFVAREEALPDNGTTEALLLVDLDNDSYLDLVLGNRNTSDDAKTKNRLWRNIDGFSFEDLSDMLQTMPGWTWSVSAADLDGDGDQDLFVANDTLAADFGNGPGEALERQGDALLRNELSEEGVLRFTDITSFAGLDVPRSSMGGLIGDFNADARLDIYISNFGANYAMLGQEDGSFVDGAAQMQLQGTLHPSRLCPSDTRDPRCLLFSWGAALVDLDLDGAKDLIVANGDSLLGERPPVQIHLGRKEAFTQPLTLTPGPLSQGLEGQGLIAADFDGDGDVDVVLGSRGGTVNLLENRSPLADGLSLELVGTKSNREGRGAVVTAVYDDGTTATHTVGSGGIAFSSLPSQIFLGGGSTLRELVVDWPSGGRDRYPIANDRKLVRVTEGEGVNR